MVQEEGVEENLKVKEEEVEVEINALNYLIYKKKKYLLI